MSEAPTMSSAARPRIALITSSMDNRPAKGTARVTRRYVEHLLQHQEEFDITLIHERSAADPLYAQAKELCLPDIAFPFGRKLFNEAIFWLRLRASGTQFDIVHYLNPRVWPSYLLAPARRIVINAYEAGVMLNYHHPDLGTRIFQVTNRYLHQRMHAIIALSEYGKREIVEHFHVPMNVVHVIYCGVDNVFSKLPDIERRRVDLTARFGLPERYLLSIGRLDPHKNIVRLIQAYSSARTQGLDIPLVLVGGKHLKEYSDEVACTARELNVEAQIIYAPFIPDADLATVYNCATALIYPSLHEGFGLPLVEAMACGIPIAASNATSLPEVAGDAAILFDPLDIQDMTRAIIAVTRHDDTRNRLITKGNDRVRQFTWEHATAQLLELYRGLVNS